MKINYDKINIVLIIGIVLVSVFIMCMFFVMKEADQETDNAIYKQGYYQRITEEENR